MNLSASESLNVSSTSPGDWKYVSEGGATIVFSYRGPSHAVFAGTVLRLRKVSRKLSHDVGLPSEPESVVFEGEEEEPDDPSISFQQKVTSQLIPPAYLPRLVPVRVEQNWLETLKAASQDARPLERQRRDEIDVHHRKGVLATDLVGGDGLAVEIKPKWGFLPNLEHLSPETRAIKSRRCRFCMHTQFRSGKGDSASHEYCPLDLFSGSSSERVSHALRCLWEAWMRSNGAVNNLKIFADGEIVDPQKSSEKLQKILIGSLNGTAESDLMEAFVSAILPILIQTPVLQRIAQLQRTLDSLDMEGLLKLHTAYAEARFAKSPGSAPALEDLFPDPLLDEWVRFVATYQSQDPITEFDPAHLHYYTMAYLLSATFKDCSIMLRLGQGPDVPDSITVIDLDPKSMKRLKQWAELDRNIVTSFVDDGTLVCRE